MYKTLPSYNIISGMASILCEITSGGVRIAPIINESNMAYRLPLHRLFIEIKPIFTSIINIIGN